MKATREVHPVQETYCLTMNLREACWLSGICQNPMRKDETEEDERMRRRLFEAMTHPTRV